jgi:DNA-binding transcriptional LysR family regulator
LELRHLRYFVAVAEHLHFGRAAEALATAQPSLSRQIVQLEEELHVKLFERSNRSVQLTEAGRALLVDARRTLQSADATVRHARENADGTRGELRIGFLAGAMLMTLPAIFRTFRRRYPNVTLVPMVMRPHQLVPALRAGAIDVAWTVAVSEPDIISRPVATDELLAAIPADHPLATKTELAIADFGNEALIILSRSVAAVMYEEIMKLCSAHGYRPAEILEVREEPSVLGLVAAGFGIALVPHPYSVIQIPGVVFRRLLSSYSYVEVLCWHRDRDTPIVRSFATTVLAMLAER